MTKSLFPLINRLLVETRFFLSFSLIALFGLSWFSVLRTSWSEGRQETVAIREQAQSNFAKAAGILALYEKLKLALPNLISTQFSVQVIDALFDRPIFESSEFIERTQISKRTALRVLAALEQADWLRTVRPAKGRSPALLSFPELIALTE